jgi:uncharacterized protein (DUF952 family)
MGNGEPVAASIHLAEAVRGACLTAARDGFEQAATDGLCAEGAVEAALSAIQRLDLADLLRRLKPVLHITTEAAWAGAKERATYEGDTLAGDGFIHFSTPEQVVRVANALFRDRNGLVLLVVDPSRLSAPLRYEDCYDSGEAFPHLYGPLPVAAVIEVVPFSAGPDGRFTLPPVNTL